MARSLSWVLVVVAVAAGVWFLTDRRTPELEPDDPGYEEVDGDRGGDEQPDVAPGLKARSPGDDPGATERTPLPEGAVRVVGVVVMPDEAPAVGASVELVIDQASVLETTTDARGAFELVATREVSGAGYPQANLRIRADGHGLVEPFVLRSKVGPEIDVGTLQLRAGTSLEVHALVPSGATGPTSLWFLHLGRWGAGVLYQRVEADRDGRASVEALPPGTWRILATAAGSGRGEVFVKLPQTAPEVVEVEMPDERTGLLTVLDAETKQPVAGATVVAHEFIQAPAGNFSAAILPALDPAVTDADGRLTFRGLTKMSSLTLFISAEGYPLASNRYGVTACAMSNLRRDDEEATVELQKARTISWPVVDGPQVPAPPDGTKITLRAQVGSGRTSVPEGGVIEHGRLVVAGWSAGYPTGLAVTPEGAMARLWADPEAVEGPEIHFVPARKIDVTVRYPDGQPVVGMWVSAYNQGNNRLKPPVQTDAEGHALIEDLFGGARSLVQVQVNETDAGWGGAVIATVNLKDADGKVEGTIRRTLGVTLRIRIDGEARLPEISEQAPTGGIGIRLGRLWNAEFDVDESRGEIRFDWRPASGVPKAWINVSLAGHVAFAEHFDVPETPEPLVFDVELKKAGSILVACKPSTDGQRQRINVQVWNDAKNAWQPKHLPMMAMGGYARPDAEGQCLLQPLESGRYRVLDVMNFVATGPIDVVAGAEPATAALDGSKAGFVRGRVEVPAGFEKAGIRILTEGGPDFGDPFRGVMGGGTAPKGLWTQTNQEGEFWLRVPGTMTITLRAEGLGLVPAGDGGRVTVTKPKEGLVLRLVKGVMARVRFDQVLSTQRNPGRARNLQVVLYDGKPEGEPVKSLTGKLDGEGRELVFGGWDPGTYTVWIDAGPYLPVVIEDVALGESEVDLGEVDVSEGGRVVIEVKLKEGAAMPRMYAWAHHLGNPKYQRSTNSGSSTTMTITGLGAGEFQINVGSHMGAGGASLHEVVRLDGAGEIKRTIDLTK